MSKMDDLILAAFAAELRKEQGRRNPVKRTANAAVDTVADVAKTAVGGTVDVVSGAFSILTLGMFD